MSVRRSRAAVKVAVAAVGLLLLGACGDSDPSAGEKAVCDSMQTMADAWARGDGEAALAQLAGLQQAAAGSGNAAMETAADELFRILGEDVEDYQDLTVQESIDLGNRALERSAMELGRLGDACVEAGQPVEGGPPSTPGDP